MKTMVILVDGMRPDEMIKNARAKKIADESLTALDARTVMPSVTLPCHMSLFHSVDPSRHGTTTNTYAPQVRPIRGLCETLANAGKSCAFFYNWEELRDLSRPGSLMYSAFFRGHDIGWEKTNDMVTDATVHCLETDPTDFTFCYLGYVDEAGHADGWCGTEYTKAMENSWANIERILAAETEEFTTIILADHGGHGRSHGTEMPEDMTIPIVIHGKDIRPGKLENASIMDVAPTVCKLLDVKPDRDWEGKSLL